MHIVPDTPVMQKHHFSPFDSFKRVEKVAEEGGETFFAVELALSFGVELE
jgi:hypothetical protein